MTSVCKNASSKVWTPLPGRFIDEHLVEMFPLFDQLINVMHPVAMLPTRLVVYRVQVRTVGAGAMKSGVSQVNSSMVSRALWAGALSC